MKSALRIAGIAGVLGLVLVAGGIATRPKHGVATVVVYDDGEPLSDRVVVFQDPGGRVVATTRSGADGRASADVAPGSMITVAYGNSVRRLVTVTGVMPGDQIAIGETEDEGEAARSLGLAHVVTPASYPGAARQTVDLGVGVTEGRPGQACPVPVLRRFVGKDQKFDVLAEAVDAKGKPLAFSFERVATAQEGDVDVRLPAWSTEFREQRIVLANAPAGLARASAELAILAGEEDRFDRGRREAVVSDETHFEFRVPRPLGTSSALRLELAYANAPDRAIVSRRAHAMPSDVRVDLGGTLLPRVSRAQAEGTADRARPVVHWNVAGDTSRADAAIVELTWPSTKEHVWTIVGSPEVARVRVPQLPAELAAWAPDGRRVRASVAVVEASFYDGFADVRKKGIHLLAEPPEDDEAAAFRASVTGDMVL